MSDVTRILNAFLPDDPGATEELLPLVYSELRKLAASKMASQPPGQTIQATVLVHEAFIKLSARNGRRWNDRRHFFATAAEAMRHILIDRARKRRTVRHGGNAVRYSLDSMEGLELPAETPGDEDTLLAVNEALDLLAEREPAKAQVVKLKFFVGLQNKEIAEILDVSTKTVQRQWITARAWLFQQLDESGENGDG